MNQRRNLLWLGLLATGLATFGPSRLATSSPAQAKAVLLTVVWSGVVSLIAYKLVDMTIGLRVTEEDEREGLDIAEHGETAYHN